MSTENKFPEMYYFMNESVSDVVFIVEGQRLPALKSYLSVKNKVFRVMFSENLREDKELVIKDTTFDAFKTLIQFLYSEQLVLKDRHDFTLIEEVYHLSDRYKAYRLLDKIVEHIKSFTFTLENIGLISRIAGKSDNKDLIENVITFVVNNLEHLEDFELIAINDLTHNYMLKAISNNYLKLKERLVFYKRGRCFNCVDVIEGSDNPICNECKQYAVIPPQTKSF